MKERKVLVKEVPIRHNRHGTIKTILLMSVGVGIATMLGKNNNPRKNFYIKKI